MPYWKIIGALVLKEQEEIIWALCFRTENGGTCEHWFTKCGKFFTLPHDVIYLFSPFVSHSIHSCVLFKIHDLDSDIIKFLFTYLILNLEQLEMRVLSWI